MGGVGKSGLGLGLAARLLGSVVTVALSTGLWAALNHAAAGPSPVGGPRASDPVPVSGMGGTGAVLGGAAAGGLRLLFTETDAATNETRLLGVGVEREGVLEGFAADSLMNAQVTGYANTTIPVEFSLLGVPATPGGAATPAPGSRAAVLEDFLLNSSLQNPGQETGLQVGFQGPGGAPASLVNGPGGDLLVVELSPPVGTIPPSGGDPVQGGDPFGFFNPATGASVDVLSPDFEQFGGNGQAANNTFFAAVDTNPMVLDNRVASLEDLENVDLFMVAAPTPTGDLVSVFALNFYGTVVDLSELGLAEGEALDSVGFQSIAPPFGPDFALVAGLPTAGTGTSLIQDGVLNLSLLGPITSDFGLTVIAPAGGPAPFSFVTPPLFTEITASITPDNVVTIEGDYLLDGSVPLSTQSELVAGAVEAIIVNGGASAATFAALTAISDLGAEFLDFGLDQLAPEIHLTQPRLFSSAQALGLTRALTDRADRLAFHADVSRAERGVEFWIDGFGDFSELDPVGRFGGADIDTTGIVVGGDFWLTDHIVLGGTAGFSGGEGEAPSGLLDFDGFQFAGYGLYVDGPFRAATSAGFGFGDVEGQRFIALTDSVETARSEYDVNHVVVHGEASYRFYLPVFKHRPFWIEPQGAVTFIHHDQDGFEETGADGFNLLVSDASSNQLFIGPELRAGTAVRIPGITLIPEVTGGYRYDVIEDDLDQGAQLIGAGGVGFVGLGQQPDRGGFTTSLGLTAAIDGGIAVFAQYDGRWSDDLSSNAISGGVQISF